MRKDISRETGGRLFRQRAVPPFYPFRQNHFLLPRPFAGDMVNCAALLLYADQDAVAESVSAVRCFSKSGFTGGLTDLAKKGEVTLVTLDDLYR